MVHIHAVPTPAYFASVACNDLPHFILTLSHKNGALLLDQLLLNRAGEGGILGSASLLGCFIALQLPRDAGGFPLLQVHLSSGVSLWIDVGSIPLLQSKHASNGFADGALGCHHNCHIIFHACRQGVSQTYILSKIN